MSQVVEAAGSSTPAAISFQTSENTANGLWHGFKGNYLELHHVLR